MKSKHIHHDVHRAHLSYPVSLVQRLYSIFLGPLLVVGLMLVAVRFFAITPGLHEIISVHDLLLAAALTIGRIGLAYALAVIVAIPLALLVTKNSFTEKIFLPSFDILQSVPILAFFPILILIFIRFGFLNGAAIFILFLSMLWNIVFTLVGGLKIIPVDITYAARVFGLKGFAYFDKMILPAIIPQLVTGSILAVAQGWNIIIVAEVLHVYIPGGTSADDLFGLGSLLVRASANGQTQLFMVAVAVMVFIIALVNFFVWQKLLKYAQRFRFE